MKRLLILVGLASFAATGTAMAVFAETNYHGGSTGTNPEFSIEFKLHRSDSGVKKVRNVIVFGLDYECEAGSPGEVDALLDESFRVDGEGRFGGRADAIVVGIDPPAKLVGQLRRHGKAVGTIRLHGELDPEGQPEVKCETGTQDWKATKDPPTP